MAACIVVLLDRCSPNTSRAGGELWPHHTLGHAERVRTRAFIDDTFWGPRLQHFNAFILYTMLLYLYYSLLMNGFALVFTRMDGYFISNATRNWICHNEITLNNKRQWQFFLFHWLPPYTITITSWIIKDCFLLSSLSSLSITHSIYRERMLTEMVNWRIFLKTEVCHIDIAVHYSLLLH